MLELEQVCGFSIWLQTWSSTKHGDGGPAPRHVVAVFSWSVSFAEGVLHMENWEAAGIH